MNPGLEFWNFLSKSNTVSIPAIPVGCHIQLFCNYWLEWIPSWWLVGFTFERVLAVLYPHKIHLWISKKVVCFWFTGVVFLLLVPCVFFAIFIRFEPVSTRCVVANLQQTIIITDILLATALPFVLILTGNLLIIGQMIWNHRRDQLGEGLQSQHRNSHVTQLTITLLVVSLVFVLLTLPYNIKNYLPASDMTQPANREELLSLLKETFRVALLKYIKNMNNGINFWLYSLSGQHFRDKLKRRFCRKDSTSNSTNNASH